MGFKLKNKWSDFLYHLTKYLNLTTAIYGNTHRGVRDSELEHIRTENKLYIRKYSNGNIGHTFLGKQKKMQLDIVNSFDKSRDRLTQ